MVKTIGFFALTSKNGGLVFRLAILPDVLTGANRPTQKLQGMTPIMPGVSLSSARRKKVMLSTRAEDSSSMSVRRSKN
jgi:hypothetical protein